MKGKYTFRALAVVIWAVACFNASSSTSGPTALSLLPPELASYEPRGGRNLAEQLQVNPTTGDLSYWESDLPLSESASALVLQRFYRSLASGKEAGLFGRGWRTLFERRLAGLNPNTCVLADEWGGTWLFSRSDDGQWWAERGPARRIEPSAEGMALHDSDGTTWQFAPSGSLTAVSDKVGRRLTIERDREPPATIRTVRDSTGNALSFATNADGLIERVTSSNGQSVSYEYREGRLVGAQTDRGAATRYSYDNSGRLSEIRLPNGSVIAIKSDDLGRVLGLSGKGVLSRTYSYRDHVPTDPSATDVTRPGGPGNATRWRVSENGRRVEMAIESGVIAALEKNDRGLPAQLTLAGKIVRRWKYDARGRLAALEGPQGETTRFAYSGNRLQPDRIERADGSTVRFEYDDKERCIAAAIGNQSPWRYEYDDSGHLQKFENFFHGRYEIAYDEKGRVAALVEPVGAKILIGRDDRGCIVSVGRTAGPAIRFERDEAGHVKTLSDGIEWLQLGYNESGNVTSLLGSQGCARRFYYTAEGMPSTLQGTAPRALRLFYDGERNCIAFQRAEQTALHMARGPLGQIRMLDAAGLARWTVDYDAGARPIRWQKQGFEPTRLEYDGAGRIRTLVSSSGSSMTLRYDSAGPVASLESPLRRFQFVFNPVGRLQTLIELTGGKRDTFEYDEANRMVRRSCPGWTEHYRYDRAGRVIGWTVADLGAREYGFRYSEAGWLEEITFPNGVRSTFDFDAAHRLTRVGAKDGEGRALFTTAIDHPTSSRLAAATGGGGDRFAYRYDANLALVETTGSDGAPNFFAYDPRGGLLFTTSTARREIIRRDALGRPTEVGAARYVYLGPNDAPPPMTSATVCLTLDDRDRVIALRRGDGLTVRYAYLPDGRMIRREVKGRVVGFDWDGPRLRATYDERGRSVASIHHDPTFGLPLAVGIGGRTYFCHPDPFGHPALLTDEKGKQVEPPADFPFEIRKPNEAPIGPTWEGLPPAIRLPDEGLWLVRGRLCDLRSGDFLSPDLARFVESDNPYRARVIPRPIEPTNAWAELAEVLRWIEQIEKGRLGRTGQTGPKTPPECGMKTQWARNVPADMPLSELAPLVRRPELLEQRSLETAFHHDLNPERWLEGAYPAALCSDAIWPMNALPGGPRDSPPSPADAFTNFSPLGPIPWEWDPAATR